MLPLLGVSGFPKAFHFPAQSVFRVHISVLGPYHKPVRSELLVKFPLLRKRTHLVALHKALDKDSLFDCSPTYNNSTPLMAFTGFELHMAQRWLSLYSSLGHTVPCEQIGKQQPCWIQGANWCSLLIRHLIPTCSLLLMDHSHPMGFLCKTASPDTTPLLVCGSEVTASSGLQLNVSLTQICESGKTNCLSHQATS